MRLLANLAEWNNERKAAKAMCLLKDICDDDLDTAQTLLVEGFRLMETTMYSDGKLLNTISLSWDQEENTCEIEANVDDVCSQIEDV